MLSIRFFLQNERFVIFFFSALAERLLPSSLLFLPFPSPGSPLETFRFVLRKFGCPAVADRAQALEICRPQVIRFLKMPPPESPSLTRITRFLERKICFFGCTSRKCRLQCPENAAPKTPKSGAWGGPSPTPPYGPQLLPGHVGVEPVDRFHPKRIRLDAVRTR